MDHGLIVLGIGLGTAIVLGASLGTAIALGSLAFFFPAPEDEGATRSVEDLRREYGKWDAVAVFLFFIIVPLFSFLWWHAFLPFVNHSGFSRRAGTIALWPDEVVWLLPAILLGFVTAGPLHDAILRGLLQERLREYVTYLSRRDGVDWEALEVPFYLGCAGLAVLLVVMASDWYAIFTPTEIRLDPFLGSRERVFEYADVVSIETAPVVTAPIGRLVDRREYVVRFSDSSSWNTDFLPADVTESDVRSLVQTISERSGVPITKKSVLTREDLQ